MKKNTQTPVITMIKDALNKTYDFRFNTVLDRYEYKARNKNFYEEVDESFINSKWVELMEKKISFSPYNLKSLIYSSFSKPYHPFQEYFKSLPKWDGEHDYLTDLSNSIDTGDQKRWDYYLKKWIVAMVACAVTDHLVNHTALVLSGGQGLGKTTWLNKLVPEALKEYRFVGTLIPGDKDSLAVISDCILINLDEFEALSPTVQSKLKSLITLESTRQRRPYKESSKVEIRRASFCASVNNSDFLNDITGSRRFLCFETKAIGYDHIIDMNKVFAQAYAMFNNGFTFHLTKEDIHELNRYNEKFRKTSDEEELLSEYIRKPELPNEGQKMTSTEILNHLSLISNIDNTLVGMNVKIGKALTNMGFESMKSGGVKYYKISFISKSS